MAHLAFIIASDGNNASLARDVAVLAQDQGHTVDHIQLNGYDFPLYTAERERVTDAISGLAELMERMATAEAWFVFAPEYNGSHPPVLNNAIAWLSRQGDDFRRLFRDRPVALGTHSGGGGAHVIMSMRQQFSYLGCNVIGRSLVTNKNKTANPDSVNAMLNSLCRGL